jgi:hypothetical protein
LGPKNPIRIKFKPKKRRERRGGDLDLVLKRIAKGFEGKSGGEGESSKSD